ncbi:MAG: class I SAM-dependent RNA methyltransferase [Candidatus Nanopelagicales bacterium]
MNVGDRIALDVTSMAHGGEAVARHEGRVVFVRDAIPGEGVIAELTSVPAHGRFMRARAVEIAAASPDRVTPPCAYAGSCGGCDWQHIALAAQRRFKAAVVAEQLTRIGGEPPGRWSHLEVEPVEGDVDGLQWRTRMRYAVDREGRAGLRAHHAHDIIPIRECLIASPAIGGDDVLDRTWPGAHEILAVQPDGAPVLLPNPAAGRAKVSQHAAGREWTFDATAFWQVHPGAPDALVDAVRAMLRPKPGDHLVDLYAGVGLFAGAYVEVLGPGGRIDAVEADETAVKGARRSLHDAPTIHIHHDRVDRWLRHGALRRCDLVVLDPPRTGAGREVMERTSSLRPRAIAYVACDPAALARDIATARQSGWEMTDLRAFDLFSMTHHVECIALLERRDSLET